LFPPISEEDFDKLVADIKANGLHQHIVRYQGKILDGNNRYRACSLAGIEPTFADFTGIDADAQRYVVSANIHRRHLSPEQRRDIIAMLLKDNPGQSNRMVAAQTNTSKGTVQDVREELETTGQIGQLETTTGKDGKARKTKSKTKSKAKKSTTEKEKETIKYQVVVDAITANKAYQLFEQYLLDALEQLAEFSSVEHAEEYAEETIEKLQTRLGQLQPQEEEAA
jgi:hypothetical protein